MTLHDRSVLVTGHTGFKGGWLAMWLAELGARVHGYALAPPTEPNLFEAARIGEVLASDTRADVRDLESLRTAVNRAQPEVVFHLAAQPLVRESYRDPVGTTSTNVLGTANLLEAVRSVDSVRAVVAVATDKVYANREAGRPFAESDPLGGHDPYSASKAAAEIMVSSYRRSFFGDGRHPARIASARSGNVVGGGDWSADRLVPDCLRAFAANRPVVLRHPEAVRPWQHVLDPLAGYLELAARLLGDDGGRYARAWNFGPDPSDDATVGEVAGRVADRWGHGARIEHGPKPAAHESRTLRLDSAAARTELGWRSAWPLDETIARTVDWHRAWLAGDDMAAHSRAQIAEHARAVVA